MLAGAVAREERKGRRMTHSTKRMLYTSALGAVVVPLLVASYAFACTSLATLSVSPGEAVAGTTVSGTGKNFRPHGSDPAATEPVVVRFNSRTGTALWSGRPDASGSVNFSFTVPAVEPGQYTIIATQNTSSGAPASGTPARVAFTVTPSPVAPEAPLAAVAEEPAAAAPVAAPAAAPARTTAPAPAPASRVRPAPTAAATPAQAPAAASAPAPAPAAAPTPVPEATPAPAVTPEPAAAPATAPRRSVMVSMAAENSDGSPVLAIVLVGVGLALAIGATALVLAGRRDREAPATSRR